MFVVNGGTLTASGPSTFNTASNGNEFSITSGLASFNGGINLGTDNPTGSDLISVTGGTLTASSILTGRCLDNHW